MSKKFLSRTRQSPAPIFFQAVRSPSHPGVIGKHDFGAGAIFQRRKPNQYTLRVITVKALAQKMHGKTGFIWTISHAGNSIWENCIVNKWNRHRGEKGRQRGSKQLPHAPKAIREKHLSLASRNKNW